MLRIMMDEEVLLQLPSRLPDHIECPEDTKWKIKWQCCWCPIAVIPSGDRVFCRHWEINLIPPVFVGLFTVFCYSTFLFGTCRFLPGGGLRAVAFIETTAAVALFTWSYFAAVCADPGFLPYSWAATQRLRYSWEEQLSGLAVRPDQIAFGSSHRPPFASFSTQAGRYVIRADHICGWIANWVGKRNHKQFLLISVWGMVAIASLISWSVVKSEVDVQRNPGTQVCVTLATIFEAISAFLMIIALGTGCTDMCNNRTQIQRWKNEEGEGRGCFSACKQVFGSGPRLLWLIPTPAFGENPFE
jgi:hypothetical protein